MRISRPDPESDASPEEEERLERLISAAFGQEMKIIEAIDNNALRVEEDRPPITATFQTFSLWTPTQTTEGGNVEFTVKSKVEEGLTVLLTQLRGLGERKHYGLFRGTKELTWNQLSGDPVTIVPKEIPKSERGGEVDTTTIACSRAAMEVGPMILVKWQLFNWEHQPQSEVREVDIFEEITFVQFVEKHVTKLMGWISPQVRFRAGATLPVTIPSGCMLEVEAKEIASMKEALALARRETRPNLPKDQSRSPSRKARSGSTLNRSARSWTR
jgi:hypothetical protein